MNDRFLFRVVNKETKKYEHTRDVEESSVFLLSRVSSKYIVEQCTGFKDENGRLIYEGDIVRVFYDFFNGVFTEKEVVGPVVWKCGNWVVNGWFLNCAPEYDETHLESSFVEVIGNIHENPELLVKPTIEERVEEITKNNPGIPDYDAFYKALREGK